MALDGTYSGLQASIAKWLNRSDLTNEIIDFIFLAEAEMSRRLRRMSRRETITITGAATYLPCAAAELRSINLLTGSPHLDRPISVGTPEMLAERRASHSGVVGRPQWAAITSGGRELLMSPAPDQSYDVEIIYFTRLQNLSTDNVENDELREAPDLYLYGALLQAEPYLENDSRIPVWQTKFDNAINQLNDVRDREEHSAGLQPIRLPMVFG